MNLKNFVNIGGELKTNHRIYSYVNDAEYISMDDMLANGFFNEAFGQLKVDDKILVYDSKSYETLTVTSIDNGVIKTKKLNANSSGGDTPGGSGSDNNGLEGDYCSRYGIVDETTSGLPKQGTGNQVIIPAGLVLDVPGVPGLTTVGSMITHSLTSTTNCELWLANGEVLEVTDMFWQETEPEDGTTGYAGWWNGTEMKFKSNDTGNVWRAANAGRIAKCVFTDGNLTRLCFTGCRLLNKQEWLPLSGGTLTGPVSIFKQLDGFSVTWTVAINSLSGTLEISSSQLSSKFGFDSTFAAFIGHNMNLGTFSDIWDSIYVRKINNGADIAVPTTGGTMVVATPPTEEGTCHLKTTVTADGTVTTAWVKDA